MDIPPIFAALVVSALGVGPFGIVTLAERLLMPWNRVGAIRRGEAPAGTASGSSDSSLPASRRCARGRGRPVARRPGLGCADAPAPISGPAGGLVEVRADPFRFSLQEAEAFLNDRLHLALSPRPIARLEERTEGWVAGLQLVGITLEGVRDGAFGREFS